jgi:hypothetical protein
MHLLNKGNILSQIRNYFLKPQTQDNPSIIEEKEKVKP